MCLLTRSSLLLSVLMSLMIGSTLAFSHDFKIMVAGLATRGCRPPATLARCFFFIFCVTGRSFVSLGVAKCLAVCLGQVSGVVVAARVFLSFPFSHFLAARGFLSFFFSYFWAAQEYFRFLFSCFQSEGGGLGVLYRGRGLASPGPHLGAKAGLSCASRFSESWVFFSSLSGSYFLLLVGFFLSRLLQRFPRALQSVCVG